MFGVMMRGVGFEFSDYYVLDAMCDNHVEVFDNLHVINVSVNGKRCNLFDFTATEATECDGYGADGVCIFEGLYDVY